MIPKSSVANPAQGAAIQNNGLRCYPAPMVLSAKHGDATVLLDLNTNQYYSLDKVGSLIWSSLCQGLTQAEIASAIAGEFVNVPTEVLSDVDRFVDTLRDHGLVERRAAT